MNRSRAVMFVSGLGLGLALVLVPSAPVAAAPEVAPQVSLVPVVKVTSIEVATSVPNTLGFWVKVHNGGNVLESADLFFSRAGEASSTPHPLKVAAKGDTNVLVVDKVDGMNCGVGYKMRLVGTAADPTMRTASLDTTCTFLTTVEDSLAMMTADQRQRQTSGKLAFSNVTATKFLTCTSLNVKADLYNGSGATSAPLQVAVRDAKGATLWIAGVPAIPSGGTHVVHMTQATIDGAAQQVSLVLLDPQNKMAGKIASQSIDVHIAPACSAVAHLQ